MLMEVQSSARSNTVAKSSAILAQETVFQRFGGVGSCYDRSILKTAERVFRFSRLGSELSISHLETVVASLFWLLVLY